MDAWWLTLVVLAVAGVFLFGIATSARKARSGDRRRDDHRASAEERHEALFKAAFPELQPLFHPANVLEFVAAWSAQGAKPEWLRPPGLDVARARLSQREKGEAVELFDAAGALVSRFRLQPHPDGGVLRLDPGKFTVNVRDAAVRYWHPEREFQWSRARGWRLITRLSDPPLDSTDRGFEQTRDSSPSSTATTTVATAAAIVAAGGTFAGAGASAKWDDGDRTPAGSDSPGEPQSPSESEVVASAVVLATSDSETPSSSPAY